ncbi:Phr family secreted Rap phosphatase inhibitor [Bacillus thuringiensis]|uniref:Phr family secreted Rap phosphatase inhibitor n=1 Tax=Bacillus sp. NPDC094077 TaxID=3390932 RepID=UPI001876323C|nr:Phr family secreted Rap phosphatase inhibitor [Bacillus thuringiensis]
MKKKLSLIALGLGLIGFLAIGANTNDKAVAYGDYPAPALMHSNDYDGAHGETI